MLLKLHYTHNNLPLLIDTTNCVFETLPEGTELCFSTGSHIKTKVKESLEEIEVLISQTATPRRVLVTTHKETFEATFIQFCPYATLEGEAGLLCYYEKDDGQVDSQLAEMVKFITPEIGK